MTSHSRLATVASVVLVGLIIGGLGLGLSLLYGLGVPIAVCLLGGILLSAAGAALCRLPAEDTGELAPDSAPATGQRASFGDLRTVQTRFAGSDGDIERFEDRVRRPLAELTAELLRQRHHIDWRAQPGRAQDALGPVLWQLVTTSKGQFPASREQADAWIQAIEAL